VLEGRGFRDTGDWPLRNALDRAREWEASANVKHAMYVAARDTLYTTTYVEGDADLLNAVADELTCGDGCENCSREWDTNATSCALDDRPDEPIGCRYAAADQLRAIAKALAWLADNRKATGNADGVTRGPAGPLERGTSPNPKKAT